MYRSALTNPGRNSPLQSLQKLQGDEVTNNSHRNQVPFLPLTSLIDAFCIIVIYLLIGTQSGLLEVPVSERIQLPQAESSGAIEKETPILRIENGSYFVNDRTVRESDLEAAFKELKKAIDQKNPEILIQADRHMNYRDLDPVLKAGSLAGIEKLKFAVMPTK